MLAIARYLVSTAEATLLSVLSNEWSNAVYIKLVKVAARRQENIQDFLVVFENCRDLLEVQALEAATLRISELNCVVLQAPIIALQWYQFVDLLEEFGYGRIVLELDAKDDTHFGKRVTPYHES